MRKLKTRAFPADFSDLIAAFDAEEVEYLLIGGWAVGVHGRPRATKDLDLWIAGGANLRRVSLALARFGLPRALVDAARALARDEILFFGAPPLRVDLLRSIPGVTFAAAKRRAARATLGALSDVPVISIDDLIRNKQQAGRPQDVADAAALLRIRERQLEAGKGGEKQRAARAKRGLAPAGAAPRAPARPGPSGWSSLPRSPRSSPLRLEP